MKRSSSRPRVLFLVVLMLSAILSGAAGGLFATCGPFTDTPGDAFCGFILEVFYVGITTGTSATTYDPTATVNRTQMAAFLSRTVDSTLKRGSRRAAVGRFWTTQGGLAMGATLLGNQVSPFMPRFDGADVWTSGSGLVTRVRASDARLLETWTASQSGGVLIAMNRVLVTGVINPGKLYVIDPSLAAGAATVVASNVGKGPSGIAFDGGRVWTTSPFAPGDVSIITPTVAVPWTVTTFSVGVGSTAPAGIVFDGSSIWITDAGVGTLLKLDAAGGVLQTVTVGSGPAYLAFDGGSLWIPNQSSSSVTVVRASSGTVLGTLTGNGLNVPSTAAFDGERILVTNYSGDSVSLWKAADLSPLGTFPTGPTTGPSGACSDGVGFWIALNSASKLAHF